MRNKVQITKKDTVIFISYIILIILTRTIFHIAPGIEFITGTSIAAAFIMKNRKLAYLVPLFGLLISDFILGNTLILLFTWSAFLCAPAFGMVTKRLMKKRNGVDSAITNTLGAQITGLIFNLFFFLWTNFGVVLTTTMYSKNLHGLIESYMNGLPFLKVQLGANLIIVPAVFLVSIFLFNYSYKFKLARLRSKIRAFKLNLITK
jgi:hypothetical protein